MSKNDGRISEHYVPRYHIQSFSEDGTPNTCVTVLMRGSGKPFKSRRLDGICAVENFYDAGDPFDKNSMEKILAGAERYFNKKLEEIKSGDFKSTNFDVAVFYIALMDSRSLATRAALDRMKQFFGCDVDVKIFHAEEILKSTLYLNGLSLDDYTALCIQPEEGAEFITSDNPVIAINAFEVFKEINGIEEQDSSRREGYDYEFIFFCPISKDVCLVAYPKCSKYAEQIINGNIFTANKINICMCSKAYKYVFYGNELSDDCKEIMLHDSSFGESS